MTPCPKPQKPERGTAACKAHMDKVAQLPCMICGARPVVVHHCICGRYSQSKMSDFDTIPLCFCTTTPPARLVFTPANRPG